MDKLMFTHAIAKLRVLETRLLDKTKIDRMIDSTSLNETLKVLEETEYGNFMGGLKRPEDYETLLSEELKRVYFFMYKITPEKLLVDIMGIRYDYHNIKVLLKGKYLNKDLSLLLIPVGTIDIEDLKEAISLKEYKNIDILMKEGILKVESSFEKERDPQKIDIILDNFMYKDMLFKASKLNDEFIKKYIKISIDLINMKTFLRIKKQNKPIGFLEESLIDGGQIDKNRIINYFNEDINDFLEGFSYSDYEKILKLGIEEYIKTNRLSYLEKLSENYIMDYIKKAKYISFGVEPLIGYIIAKETEIKIIRIIMVGKLNGISPQNIRERLRDVYV